MTVPEPFEKPLLTDAVEVAVHEKDVPVIVERRVIEVVPPEQKLVS